MIVRANPATMCSNCVMVAIKDLKCLFDTFSTTCGGIKNKIYCCMCPLFPFFLGVDTLCIGVLEVKY